MKITTKGQVTIPAEVRERLGLLPNTEVEFVIEIRADRGEAWFDLSSLKLSGR